MASSDRLPAILTACAVVASSAFVIKKLTEKKSGKGPIPAFLTEKRYEAIVQLIDNDLNDISNDSLYKIVRQLEFWTREDLSNEELLEVTKRLIKVATWRTRCDKIQIPKRRFGRTELQMPVITCGCMRFQNTWLPDNLPITISKKKVVKTPSQDNILEIVHNCIKIGINHFETARMYGTSEVQLMHALSTLIERGDIKRSDFILQTKILLMGSTEEFEKTLNLSWENFKNLEYFDLVSFHLVGSPTQVEQALDESENGRMEVLLKMKKQGKIKHIGFSSHGSAETIIQLIESNKFDYVNLHYHYFGSYHAEGTPDTMGGQGLAAAIKKAEDLDMGIFEISAVDKAGHLYNPPAALCRILGPNLNPIAFSALHAWNKGCHTSSVGFARPDDLDEIIEAADLYTKMETADMVQKTETRLAKHAEEKIGKEWYEKSLLNIPSFYDKSAAGIAIGHILWCHNMLHAFGMYEVAHTRYENLEKFDKWNNKKSVDENIKSM